MQNSQDIFYSIKDSIGLITLNRPAVHNALSRAMWLEIPAIMQSLQEADAAVIVITGQGKSFAAGADLAELEELSTFEQSREQWLAIRHCLNYVADFELPVIAMINGACLGGGCLLALACDLRFAANHATFGVPVAKLGILLDESNIGRLTSLVGPALAKELLFTGNTISADRAEAIGLINQHVPADQLESLVNDCAVAIISNSAGSIAESKRAANKHVLESHLRQDQKPMIESYLSEEFRNRIQRIKAANEMDILPKELPAVSEVESLSMGCDNDSC